MVITMKKDATPEQIRAVADRVRQLGVRSLAQIARQLDRRRIFDDAERAEHGVARSAGG